MQISSYLEDLIAQWLRGNNFPAAPASLALALSAADPTDDGSGLDEPTDPGYAQQAINFAAPTTSEADGTRTSNSGGVVFSSSGSGLGSVTHAALFDDSANLLMFGALDVPRVGGALDTISFAVGTIRLQLAGRFGDYLAEAVINWMRGTTMPAAPASVRLALSRANPKRDASEIDEPLSGQGYNRQVTAFGAPSTVVGVGTTIANSGGVVFGPDTTSDWGVVTHWALFAHTSDNLCAYGALSVPKNVVVGAGFGLNAGAFSLLIR